MSTAAGDSAVAREPAAQAGLALPERRWWPLISALLVVLDALLLAGALFAAFEVRFHSGLLEGTFALVQITDARSHFYLKLAVLFILLSIMIFAGAGAYQRHIAQHGTGLYPQLIVGTGLTALLAEFASYLSDRTYPIARGWLLLAWIFGAAAVIAGRLACRQALRACHRAGIFVQLAVIVGTGHEAEILEWHLRRAQDEGIHVIGFVDAAAPVGHQMPAGLTVLGHIDDLPELIRRFRIGQVLISTSDLTHADAMHVLQHVLPTEAEISLAPDLFRTLTTGGYLHRVGGDSLLVVDKVRITGVDALLKNTLDLVGALVLLACSSPFCLAATIAVKVTSPGPVFSRLPALGVGGKPFNALKFRTTLYPPEDEPDRATQDRIRRGLPLRQSPHTTALGRLLIRFSLDEVPQLLNVLARQMSLVGPYKIHPKQAALYGERQVVLLTVRPGITGVCQIYGRGELTIEERSLLDAEYVRTYSIWRDLQIMAASIPAVLRGTGAY